MRMLERAREKQQGITYTVLVTLVALVAILSFLRADYYSVFLCLLTLLLFNIPLIVDRRFRIDLPRELEAIILLFIFAAQILGELGNFYKHITWWDTMLHTVNGFLMAAIGFALIDVLNNSPKFHISLSPVFVAFVAFCFSMTVGVIWEFFEFSMDQLILVDMQKDRIVSQISSVLLHPEGKNIPVRVGEITQTVLTLADGSTYTIPGGYLDIGLIDTMKDLIVNCIGAVCFSVIGYFYLIGRSKGAFASKFIPQLKSEEQVQQEAAERAQKKKEET